MVPRQAVSEVRTSQIGLRTLKRLIPDSDRATGLTQPNNHNNGILC